jgi:glucose-1-phosphate cytidylyltransferase
MKVVLLAGGYGTRLSEYTDLIPKPMVPIGGKPILWHIMKIYSKYQHNEFYVALGYKAEKIREYFINYYSLNSDLTVDLSTGSSQFHSNESLPWKVSLIDTGADTLTGGRLLRLKNYISDAPFLLTYGDGLSNVDLDALISFHKSHGKMVTMTAVRPNARFGELTITNNCISRFEEKPQLHDGWINGGFFVVEPEFLDLIDGENVMLEKSPLEKASKMGELMAYRHDGFWQCMDNKRDRDKLESLWESGAPW